MESWCRICGRNDEEFRRFPLFSVADVSQEVIAKMISSCTDMQVSSDDGLPQQICPDCLITLSLAYSFRRLCRRTDAKFRESFEARASAEHMAAAGGGGGVGSQARRSQSQVGDEVATYDAVPVIKEEVEFYDYECSAPPPEDQWVIQNPRTIHEGAVTAAAGVMTVLHNASQYQDGGGGDQQQQQQHQQEDEMMMSSMVPMVSMEESGNDPPEYGESSGSGQKKQKKMEPERFSKRIRRQESPMLHDGTAGADPSHFLVAMPDPSGNGLLEEIITSDGQQLVINPAKQLQRCEYCRKKMKKPYKHRNGKCMETKKLSARPRCPYCHIVFVRSSSIPLHVQNSCRVYRELCATSQELPEPNDHVEEPQSEEAAPPPPVKVKNNSKTVDLKPVLQKSKPKPSLICRYCYMSFGKRANLIKHQRDKCRVLNELDVERLTSNLSALESSIAESAAADTTVQEPEPESEIPPQSQAQDDEESEETCVYCTQLVGKKTRFQHHNGRCVLGRANADHPCPYCDAAYTSRSNLLRHQREHCQKYREEQNTDLTLTNAFEGLPVEGDTSQDGTIFDVPNSSSRRSKPLKAEKKSKPSKEVEVKQRKKPKEAPVKSPPEPANFVCCYCRKGFALRDTLIEHQRSCTVRKQHKQVKCQFCGMVISNRGNLRKHQKMYCKRAPNRENAPKDERKEESRESVPESKKPKVTKKAKVKNEKPSNGSPPVEDPPKDPLAETPVETVPTPSSDVEQSVKKKPGRPSRHNKIPCGHCDREFQNKRQLKNHVRGCLKARKMYKCKYCSAAFTHPSNMGRHIRLKRCRTGVNSGKRDSVSDSFENGFQSDNSNLLSSTVNDTEPETIVPVGEDFEMIQAESSQECILPERIELAASLAENNKCQSTDEGANKDEVPVPDPVVTDEDKDQIVQEEELVPPEAIIFTEEVELREQPSATEVVSDQAEQQQPASTLDAELKEQQQQ